MSENKSLVALTHEAIEILQTLYASNGEISPELEKRLSEVQNTLAHKVDSYSWIIETLEAEEEKLRARSDMFLRAARGCKAFRDRLKENIKLSMLSMQTKELEGEQVKFQVVAGAPSLKIDEALLSNAFKVAVFQPDKPKIKEALDKGELVPGASYETSWQLRTYAAKKTK